jgi:phage major head subunit gpT-like protein
VEITQSNLDILFRTASTKFQALFNATQEFAVPNGLVEIMPMATLVQDFPWLARIPAMRKWVGPRVVNSLSTHNKRMAAEPFEDTFEVLEEHLKYDQYSVFNNAITFLGTQSKKLIDYQCAEFLKSNNHIGYDGKAMFATDHPVLGGDVDAPVPLGSTAIQSNLAVNTALSLSSYIAARATMGSYVGEDGKPLEVDPVLLVVPPQLEGIGKSILEADMIANATTNIPVAGGGQNIVVSQSNVWKGTAKLLVVKNLANMPNNWWLFDTSKIVKPMAWGQLEAPYFTYLIAPDSPLVFLERKHLYGSRAWGTLTETLWFLSYAGTSEAQYAHSA